MNIESNGLFEAYGNGKPQKEHGFFCVKLITYLGEEAEMGTPEYEELWQLRFEEAKIGNCSYREKCPIYASTLKKGVQQNLFSQKL